MCSARAGQAAKYIIPSMLSNVCFFLFTVVDGIFVGRGVGTDALGAVNLVMPFVLTVAAVVMLINMGCVTIFAIRIGRGDPEGANQVFRLGMVILTVVSAGIGLAGTVFAGPLCTLLGAGDTFHAMAVDYMFWWSLFSVPMNVGWGLQYFCRNDGAPGLVSFTVVLTTALNIFGDWLLIFPIPMGTKGAAIATGVSQSLGLFILLIHFVRGRGVLRFGRPKAEPGLVREILYRGLPEGIGQMSAPVLTLCMNLMLVELVGDLGVKAYSVISYLASFTVAVFFGTSEGLQPLFGQSYGAKREGDLKFYFRTGLAVNFLGSVIVTGAIVLFSRPLCGLFGPDPATLDYILRVLPPYAAGFVVMAFNVMITSYLYSTERSAQAILISFLRSIAVSAAVVLLLPRLLGARSIWYTFALYETIVLAVAVVLLRRSERNRMTV